MISGNRLCVEAKSHFKNKNTAKTSYISTFEIGRYVSLVVVEEFLRYCIA